jgi:hypothetical protein
MDTPTIDVEPTESESALQLRRPDIPVTLSELAALKGEAVEIIEARVQVLATLRRASIRATSPEDWLLFKAPDDQGGQIVGYLQDCGCDRVRDLYGINVYNVSKPEKIVGLEAQHFHYLVSASGRCNLTRQVVEDMEGGRSSTDDFCKGKSGAELELLVRKAARANVDGNITRELAGMKSVPIADLKEAWVGTDKVIERCRLGRGFGMRDERLGGASSKAPDVDPPVCPHCKAPGVYRPAKDGRKAFYGCPNYSKHANQKFIVDAEKWVAEHPKPVATTTPAATDAAPTAGEIFGKNKSEREPGAEG